MALRLGAVVLASGESRRFGGGDKLLAAYRGRPLLAYTLDALPKALFARRTVVTRSADIALLARAAGFETIVHDQPDITDTVRLGTRAMAGMDGCLFAVGDQPLLRARTVARLVRFFCEHPEHMVRVGVGARAGNPVIFPASLFEALCALPPGNGGGVLTRRYPERTLVMEAENEEELNDIDTAQEYQKLAEGSAKP